MQNPRSISPRLAIRFFILVLLPFLIGAVVLPHQHMVKGDSLSTPAEPKRNFSYTLNYSFADTINESAHFEAIDSVFPFAEFISFYPMVRNSNPQACFEDQGSTITYPDGITIPLIFHWTINFNGQKNLTLNSASKVCTPVRFNEGFIYDYSATIPNEYLNRPNPSNSPDVIKFSPKTIAYTRYTLDYGILQGVALIPACFLLVWYPLSGIVKMVQKGILY